MKILTFEEFRAQIQSQNVDKMDWAFVCPMCGTVQSQNLLIHSGADCENRKMLAFSCVGRLTGKGSPSEEKGKSHGCNWTLGGLFHMHELEVVTEDGIHHPQFEPATAEQAQALASSLRASHE